MVPYCCVTPHWPETPSCMFRRIQYCLPFIHWSTQTLCYCTATCANISKCRRSVVVVSMWNRLKGAWVFICQQLAEQLKLSPRFNPKHWWTLHLRPGLNRLGFFAQLCPAKCSTRLKKPQTSTMNGSAKQKDSNDALRMIRHLESVSLTNGMH